MTVALTNTRELNLDQLMRRAMQTAGIMAFETVADAGDEQWRQRSAYGRDMLEFILDRLQAEGVILRDVERYELVLEAGTASYDLPADTLDVHGDAMHQLDADSSEMTVRAMDREEYHAISDKTLEGTPSRFWLERLGTCTVYLHPVPEAVGSLFLQRKKMLADSSLGTYTPDLERYWHDYLHFELAYRYALASSLPVDEKMALKAEAAEAKTVAQNYARQFVPSQIALDHRTGWS